MESISLPIGAKQRADQGNTYSRPIIRFEQARPTNIHPYQRMWCKQDQDSNDIPPHQGFFQTSMLQLNNLSGNAACVGSGFGYEGDAYTNLYSQSQQLPSSGSAT